MKIDKIIYFFNKYVFFTKKKHSFEQLAPIDTIYDESTFSALEYAINEKNIKNIAITGIYGSGKSSILKSFFSKNKSKNTHLNISLANFSDTITNIETRDTQENTKKAQLFLNLEKTILQQIFYKVDASKIPFSRFRRIKNIKFSKIIMIIVIIHIIIAFPLYIKNHNIFINIFNSIKNNYFTILFFCCFSLSYIIIISVFIRYLNKIRINKIGFQNTEIELESENESSLLNKHIDELLYFFETTRYSVVIIEDLDRFDNNEIFIKLRELNFLLNEYEKIKRKITFIFALSDEIFIYTERTKFFDFIIPIIPIMDNQTSENILLKFKENNNMLKLLSDTFISDISLFINDMRVIKNCINEYIIFYNKLYNKKNLISDKLFAIIIYKNIMPNDFTKLLLEDGLVYNIFNERKRNKISDLIKSQSTELPNLYKKLEELKYMKIPLEADYRLKEVAKMISKININNAYFPNIKEYLSDEVFQNIKKEGIYYYKNNNGKLEKKIDQNSEILYYPYIIEKISSKDIEKINENIKTIEEKINKIKSFIHEIHLYTIKELYLYFQNEMNDFINLTVKEDKILNMFIKNGYISEDYYDYISCLYSNFITNNDREFLMRIKSSNLKSYNLKLKDIKLILSKIKPYEWNLESILNYDLLTFLLDNNIKYREELSSFINIILNQKNFEFFYMYECPARLIDIFINKLQNTWNDNLWSYLLENLANDSQSSLEKEKLSKYIFYFLAYIKPIILQINENKTKINHYLSYKGNPFSNISINESLIDYIITNLKNCNIKFRLVECNKTNKLFYKQIIDNCLFDININNIDSLLEFYTKQKSENITDYYTQIKLLENKNIILYIEENIDIFVNYIMLQKEKITESIENLIILLDNNIIPEYNKKNIAQKNATPINDISIIPKKMNLFLSEFFKNESIVPNWNNIETYIVNNNQIIDDNLLLIFNNNHMIQSLCDNYKQMVSKTPIWNYINLIYHIINNYMIDEENFNYSFELLRDIGRDTLYKNINFETISIDRFNFLTNKYIIPYDTSVYSELLNKNKNVFIIFIKNLLTNNITKQIEFDAYGFSIILDSQNLTQEEKIKIFNNIYNKNQNIVFELDNNHLLILLEILAKTNVKQEFSFDFIINILKKLQNINDSIAFINSQLSHISKEDLHKIIEYLPEPLNKILTDEITITLEIFIDKKNKQEFINLIEVLKSYNLIKTKPNKYNEHIKDIKFTPVIS